MPRAIILIAYILIVGNLSNGRTPTQTIRGVVIDAGQHDFSESIRLDRNNPVELTPLHQTDNVEGKAILSSVITHRFTVRSGVNAGNNFYRMKGDSRDRLTEEYGRFLQGSGNSWLIMAREQTRGLTSLLNDFSKMDITLCPLPPFTIHDIQAGMG